MQEAGGAPPSWPQKHRARGVSDALPPAVRPRGAHDALTPPAGLPHVRTHVVKPQTAIEVLGTPVHKDEGKGAFIFTPVPVHEGTRQALGPSCSRLTARKEAPGPTDKASPSLLGIAIKQNLHIFLTLVTAVLALLSLLSLLRAGDPPAKPQRCPFAAAAPPPPPSSSHHPPLSTTTVGLWRSFNLPAGPVHELRQSDFDAGTLRLKSRGIYRLVEDITFDPQQDSPVCDNPNGEAQEADSSYCAPDVKRAYALGFFAALTMEGEGIVLDLNGHTLRQSEAHALQQRFFALVETARQPFIPKQGPQPGGFGNATGACRGCAIVNGHLGRSAHHGIHGNENDQLLVENVTLADYEVASIHLNGLSHGVLRNIVAHGHSTAIPTRATYSGARFLVRALTPVLAGPLGEEARADLTTKRDVLQRLMDDAFDAVVAGRPLTGAAAAQFAMPVLADGTRPVDGNAYGMALSSAGVVVKEFKHSRATAAPFGKPLEDVTMESVTIKNVRAQVTEVPTISTADGTKRPQVDVAGSVIRLHEVMDEGGKYRPDPLHDLRFALAWWSAEDGGNDRHLVQARLDGRLGTLRIDAKLAAWAREGTASLFDLVRDDPRYTFLCNIDSMAHVQKGTIGLFLQAGVRVSARDVAVLGVRNDGGRGSGMCGSYRWGSESMREAGMLGYTGCQSRGVAVTSTESLDFGDAGVAVEDVSSAECEAVGVHLFNDVADVRGGADVGSCTSGGGVGGTRVVSDLTRWNARVREL